MKQKIVLLLTFYSHDPLINLVESYWKISYSQEQMQIFTRGVQMHTLR